MAQSEAMKQGASEAPGVQEPKPSYNISLNQLAPGTVRIRSGEAPEPPMRPGLGLAIGPTNFMVQSRLRAPNATTPADAFSPVGPQKQRMQADGSSSPGGRLLTSQRSPMHDSLLSQGTLTHYISSTRGPHHSSSSVKKKHQLFPTSANLGELAIMRARVSGTLAGGAAEQGVMETLEEQGEWRHRRNREPRQDSSSRLRAWSRGRSDSFGSGRASGPSLRPGLPGTTGPTEIKLQSQLPSRRALCH